MKRRNFLGLVAASFCVPVDVIKDCCQNNVEKNPFMAYTIPNCGLPKPTVELNYADDRKILLGEF